MEKVTGPKSETTVKIESSIEETNAAIVANEAVGNKLSEEKEEIKSMGKEQGLTDEEIEKLIQEGTPSSIEGEKEDVVEVEAEEIKEPTLHNTENIEAGTIVSPFIEPENKNFFNKMSAGGKK